MDFVAEWIQRKSNLMYNKDTCRRVEPNLHTGIILKTVVFTTC